MAAWMSLESFTVPSKIQQDWDTEISYTPIQVVLLTPSPPYACFLAMELARLAWEIAWSMLSIGLFVSVVSDPSRADPHRLVCSFDPACRVPCAALSWGRPLCPALDSLSVYKVYRSKQQIIYNS